MWQHEDAHTLDVSHTPNQDQRTNPPINNLQDQELAKIILNLLNIGLGNHFVWPQRSMPHVTNGEQLLARFIIMDICI